MKTEEHLQKLRETSNKITQSKRRLSVVGRRRVGKTRLLNEAFSSTSSRA